jgi:Amt family ammonium transporter
MWSAYPTWLNPGDNAWQMTAATLVGLMSIPGLAVLYGGVMQKRWSVNAMMMTFVAFSVVLVLWVLWGFKFAFGSPQHLFGASHGILANLWGKPGAVLGHLSEQGQAGIPLITTGPPFHFPTSTLVYF